MQKLFYKVPQKILLIAFLICVALVCILKIPALTDPVLSSVGLNNFGEPNQTIIEKSFASLFILLAIILGASYANFTFSRVSCFFHNMRKQFAEFIHDKRLFNKENALILLIVFVIAFSGYITLFRGNIDYQDDIDRNQAGAYAWGYYSSRWITEIANLLIHQSFRVHDRSPLGQILGLFVLALSAFILANSFSSLSGSERIRKRNIVASLILIFNPYFLECMAYKYDSVGMAASVLFPFIPFLVVNKKELFCFTSLICVLLSYLSYQASSGIYIVMVLAVGLMQYLNGSKTIKGTLVFFIRSAIAYIGAVAVFYAVFRSMAPDVNELTRLALGKNVVFNITTYVKEIFQSFNSLWILLSALICVISIVACCMYSKRGKGQTIILSALFIILGYIFSYGGYIFLETYIGTPRSIYGIGIFLAIIANVSVCTGLTVLCIPSAILAWCFFSFSFAYGNALTVQQDKDLVYERLLISDFNELFPKEDYPELKIVFWGDVRLSKDLIKLVEDFPIASKLIQRVNSGDSWIGAQRIEFFDSSLDKQIDSNLAPSLDSMDLICSRRYYDIYFHPDDNFIVVRGKPV